MKRIVSLSCLALSVLALAVGCGASVEDIEDASDELKTTPVPNPSGTYFASITANGTGCPAGSYESSISPDGQTFTVLFSKYEASLDPGQVFSIKDCTIAIDIRSPQGFSFAVSSFYYQGYAALSEPGVTLKQTAKYYFKGNPVPAKELRTDLTGPWSDSYLFSDTLAISNVVWSPCGATSTLNAQTRLVLTNNQAHTGAGYVNTASVDGDMTFQFGLSWKKCGNDKTVSIHRAFNGSVPDHVEGVVANEGSPGWAYEGVGYRLYADDSENRQALYRCIIPGTASHFNSTDPNCEGQRSEGRLGFMSTVALPGLTPLYRCYGRGDHLSTIAPAECAGAGYNNEGQQGYALPPDPNELVQIHRSYNGALGDHLLTIRTHEAEPGWTYEGPAFKLYSGAGANRFALHRCRIGQNHFLSGDRNCEGQVFESVLGYASSAPGSNTTAIYRCLSGGDHLTTSLGECQGAGFLNEGPQGYAF